MALKQKCLTVKHTLQGVQKGASSIVNNFKSEYIILECPVRHLRGMI